MDSKTDAQYSALTMVRKRVDVVFRALPTLLSVEYVIRKIKVRGFYLHFYESVCISPNLLWLLRTVLGTNTESSESSRSLFVRQYTHYTNINIFEYAFNAKFAADKEKWVACLNNSFSQEIKSRIFLLFPRNPGDLSFSSEKVPNNNAAFVTNKSFIYFSKPEKRIVLIQSLPWDEYERRR